MSKCVVEHRGLGSDGESDDEDDDDDTDASSASDDAPVRILLFAFMFMFQGYGCMVGNPQHALKMKLDPGGTWGEQESKDFQDATASFQLAKLFMRIGQIAFLVFLRPNGIVFLSYIVMFVALLTPLIGVWGMGIDSLWIVYLQYSLGGAAVGMFEGTFLTAISSLGKDTKTFTIMGAPLGFAVNNVILGLLSQCGMPAQLYYVYNAACVPIAAAIFYHYAPRADGKSDGKGCQVFANSMRHARAWLPLMIPWLIAKFIGNFVLEDGFPLLFNMLEGTKRALGGPRREEHRQPRSCRCAPTARSISMPPRVASARARWTRVSQRAGPPSRGGPAAFSDSGAAVAAPPVGLRQRASAAASGPSIRARCPCGEAQTARAQFLSRCTLRYTGFP
ncbi:unnamed protein product [Prorocentrum cordatum]|uniref:Battenin n=1 Tax=Prorocentrum cordatum TaxID=2364126 RepID=A0ABN9VG98_9DINO|nr:unnamed protein product [Polarella glacialis]